MTQLFVGPRIRLAPVDPDADAPIESAWTHDGEWLRLIDTLPARPLSPGQVKKKYEQLAKEPDKNFHFALRLNDSAAAAPAADPPAPGRLIGFARLQWVDWMHRVAPVFLGIGAPADRGQGYGQEALDLILRYGFDELGLHRVEAKFGGYNTGAARFFERNGFQLEVRRRQAVARDGQRWDMLQYALLQREWAARRPAAATEAA
jgi:RimJ/RimL family protein N-acetyltransferase